MLTRHLPRTKTNHLSESRAERIERARAIIAEVSAAHNFSVSVVTGESRCQEILRARRIAIKRVFAETGLGTPTIGGLFGDRDHTTILYTLKGRKPSQKEAA